MSKRRRGSISKNRGITRTLFDEDDEEEDERRRGSIVSIASSRLSDTPPSTSIFFQQRNPFLRNFRSETQMHDLHDQISPLNLDAHRFNMKDIEDAIMEMDFEGPDEYIPIAYSDPIKRCSVNRVTRRHSQYGSKKCKRRSKRRKKRKRRRSKRRKRYSHSGLNRKSHAS
jgi:hypothetical protein